MKEEIISIMENESVSELSNSSTRVLLQDDFELVAEEIIKLFANPTPKD